MKKNIKIILVLVSILVIAIALTPLISKKVIASGPDIYGSSLGKILKQNKIVATVNGYPIYLSDIAIPYFSAADSYLAAKEKLENILNDPNISETVKKNAERDLSNPPDPIKILNARINAILLYQDLKKKGLAPSESKVNDDLIKLENSWELNLKNYPNSKWSRFFISLKKSMGVKNNTDILKYYKRLITTDNAYKIYREKLLTTVPKFTKEQIQKEMKDKNIPEQVAITNLENDFINRLLEKRAAELKKQSDVKILDINSVKDLKRYFGISR